ncbi:hypothetical protein VYU27_007298 [Nannochloropsis oceanica]
MRREGDIQTSFMTLRAILTTRRGPPLHPFCPFSTTSTSPPQSSSSSSSTSSSSYLHTSTSKTNTSKCRNRSLPGCSASSRSYSRSYFYPCNHASTNTSKAHVLSPSLPAYGRRKRVLIQGGGIAGLSLAFFLERFLPQTYEAVIVERMGEGEDVAMTGHLALGLWVNGLRCLAKGGLSLPEVLAQGEHSFAWMLDSGYLTTDGRLLAKPGTPLQEGDLLFLRRSLLLSLLRNRVSSPILHRDQILSLEDEDEGGREGGRVRVTLQSGKEEVVDIVVGADGMFSPLRIHCLSWSIRGIATTAWLLLSDLGSLLPLLFRPTRRRAGLVRHPSAPQQQQQQQYRWW